MCTCCACQALIIWRRSLSITKWIHLNGGDDGLRAFFTRVFKCLRPEGRFVVEPQPWSSYVKARRMADDLRNMYDQLIVRPDDFKRILLDEIGFESMHELGVTGENGTQLPTQHQ